MLDVMKKDIIICIGTIGSITFDKCYRSVQEIAKNNARVKRVVVIRNKSPQSEWLNEMRLQSNGYRWCLQVDEDMYLKKRALSVLLKFAERKEAEGIRVLNASSLLYDLFLETGVGSLKLWSANALQALEFRDVLGGDRDFAKRAKEKGYENIDINEILGKHDSAPNAAVAFKKFFEYTQKIRKFSGEKKAIEFNLFLKNKFIKNNSFINKKAYDGSSFGLKCRIENKSKGGP